MTKPAFARLLGAAELAALKCFLMSVTRSTSVEILPLGADALLVRFALVADPAAMAQARRFLAHISEHPPVGAVEIAPSLCSVMVQFDPGQTTRDQLSAELRRVLDQPGDVQATPPKRIWHIPVSFGGEDGPQLKEAADMAGVSEVQAIAELTQPIEVLTIGFAPGQPYAGLLPDHWNIARQSAVTPEVPAGAVITAVRQVIMFNAAGPTGWRHIGQTAFRSFDLNRQDPILLRPGDQLKFAQVSQTEMRDLLATNADGLGGARCEVPS